MEFVVGGREGEGGVGEAFRQGELQVAFEAGRLGGGAGIGHATPRTPQGGEAQLAVPPQVGGAEVHLGKGRPPVREHTLSQPEAHPHGQVGVEGHCGTGHPCDIRSGERSRFDTRGVPAGEFSEAEVAQSGVPAPTAAFWTAGIEGCGLGRAREVIHVAEVQLAAVARVEQGRLQEDIAQHGLQGSPHALRGSGEPGAQGQIQQGGTGRGLTEALEGQTGQRQEHPSWPHEVFVSDHAVTSMGAWTFSLSRARSITSVMF